MQQDIRYKKLKVAALLVVCFGVPIVTWALLRIARPPITSINPNPTTTELIAIVLTAVTVVLAVLALIVAILAIWGYTGIIESAADAARGHLDTHGEKLLGKNVAEILDARIDARLNSFMASQSGAMERGRGYVESVDPETLANEEREPLADAE